MATLIKTSGKTSKVFPQNKKSGFSLAELYKLIDCGTVELVYLPDGNMMIVDECGVLKGRTFNAKATSLCGTPIVGDVVVTDDESEFQ